MSDLNIDMGLVALINAAGTMTVLGAASANKDAIAAATGILPRFVDMAALQQAASRTIAGATGAEAGCVTACAAAGISVAVAACMTGDNLARIENLPNTSGLRNEVILQKGHDCHFSGGIGQMIRLAGAATVEIGHVNRALPYQLRSAISERTAAALYVVSHQTPQAGLIAIEDFIVECHAQGVPVIVDASAEYDLRQFVALGADLVLYSAHKVLGGLTAGIIAGRSDLARACYLQEQGIGRAMKVGKEGIAATIAVLERWEKLDHQGIQDEQTARSKMAAERLAGVDGLDVSLEADTTGNPIVRVRLRFASGGPLKAESLRRTLTSETPAVYVRSHDSDPASLLLDPCNLSDDEMRHVVERIIALNTTFRASTPVIVTASLDENAENWPYPPPRIRMPERD